MKLEGLHGDALRSFVNSMWKNRMHGDAFRTFLDSNLDFPRWGFHLSHMAYIGKGAKTKVIYDSERCRVRFDLHNIGHLPSEDELHARYGRLHAVNDNLVVVWGDEKCWCWHYSILEPLLFLEGDSVDGIFAHRSKEGDWPLPAPLAALENSEQHQELRRMYPPAAVLMREALIWDNYGDGLFDLFDLRRPELWERYQKFIREYHTEYERLFPTPPIGGDRPLPRDRIC